MKTLKWLVDSDKGNRWLLFLIYCTAIAMTMIFNTSSVYGPIHYNDEIEYWMIAKNLAMGNTDKIFTSELNYPPMYPLSISPAFFLPTKLIYPAVLLLSNFYLTSIIFPIYILIKKLTADRRLSLVGAALILIHPFYAIISRLMLSENMFLPLFMWAVILSFTRLFPQSTIAADGKARRLETLVLGLLIGLCFLTRYINLVAIPVFLVIWWLQPFSGEKGKLLFCWEKFFHLTVMMLEIALLAISWVAIGVSYGLPKSQLIGLMIASSSSPEQLTIQRLILWAGFYIAYSVMIAAPGISLLFFGLSKFDLKLWREDKYRWMVAAVLLTGTFLAVTIRHSWKAAYNFPDPVKMQGRYLIIFSVLFLITALVVLSKYPNRNQNKKLNIFILLLSTTALLFSFLFLYDHKALQSVSSPDGAIILYGNGQLFIILAIMIQLVLFIQWKKLPYLASIVLPIGYCLVYLVTTPGIYSALIEIQQRINQPVKMTVDKIQSDATTVNYDSHMIVVYNPKNKGITYRRAAGAFLVRGFTNIEFIDKDEAVNYYAEDPTRYLIVKIDQGNGQYKTYALHRSVTKTGNTPNPKIDFSIQEIK